LRDGVRNLGEAVEEMKCREFAIVVANLKLSNTLSQSRERERERGRGSGFEKLTSLI